MCAIRRKSIFSRIRRVRKKKNGFPNLLHKLLFHKDH
jgi:hypothetical protein